MLKTKLIYEWGPDNTGGLIENVKNNADKINKGGIIFFIQVVSTKPLDILGESQKQKFNI